MSSQVPLRRPGEASGRQHRPLVALLAGEINGEPTHSPGETLPRTNRQAPLSLFPRTPDSIGAQALAAPAAELPVVRALPGCARAAARDPASLDRVAAEEPNFQTTAKGSFKLRSSRLCSSTEPDSTASLRR